MEKAYPIIGMSPGNSYFKDDTVRFLLKTVVERYGKAAVFIPDIPAISTFKALGYDEAKARSKAILKGNNLKNRTRRLIDELELNEQTIHVVEWETEIMNNTEYKEKYDMVLKMYNSNPDFREAARSTTASVLYDSQNQITDLESAIDIAIHYLLSELAFLEFAPEFFKVERVVYIYHNTWPVFENYINGSFDRINRSHLGFLQLKLD